MRNLGLLLFLSACAPEVGSLQEAQLVDPNGGGAGTTTVTRSITVSGKLTYNDLRKYGHFEWRNSTQHDYEAGWRSNQVGALDATVEVYEIDQGGSGCVAQQLMGSTTVGADGSWSWSGTVSDSCSNDLDGSNLSIAIKHVLRYCDSVRCFSVRDPGTNDVPVVWSRWHRWATPSSPKLITSAGSYTVRADYFGDGSTDGTLTDLEAQAANVFASLVDVTRAFYVQDSVPFDYATFGEAYDVFPTLKTTPGTTTGPNRSDIPAPGSGGASRTPTKWLQGDCPIHEFGHIIHFRAFDGNGNNNDYSFEGRDSWSAVGSEFPQTAFNEGWANFVVRAALDSVPTSVTADHEGCADDFDTLTPAGCGASGPCDEGAWYPRNVTLALCDWMDSTNDKTYGTNDGDHFAASSLYSLWYNLAAMYDVASAADKSAGLYFCDWVDYYVNTRNPAAADAVGDLIANNGIKCD